MKRLEFEQLKLYPYRYIIRDALEEGKSKRWVMRTLRCDMRTLQRFLRRWAEYADTCNAEQDSDPDLPPSHVDNYVPL